LATVRFKNLPIVEVPDTPTMSLSGKMEAMEEPSSSLSFLRGEQDEEEKELFSPYLLSLLPQEVKAAEGMLGEKTSPGFQKGTGLGTKLPPLKDVSTRPQAVPNVGFTTFGSSISTGSRFPPSTTPYGQRQGTAVPPSMALGVTDSPSAGLHHKNLIRRPVASGASPLSKVPPKAPLTQRDVIALLEKRQFIVYPLSLPAAPVSTIADRSYGYRTTPAVTDGKKAPRKLKSLISAASLSEDVFLKQQMELQHSNAEAMVEEADPINCAAFLVSMTPMQLMQSTLKISGDQRGQPFSIGQQYCSIPVAKLALYFSSTHLPDRIKNALLLSRHQASEVFVKINEESSSLIQGFSVPRNSVAAKGVIEDDAVAGASFPLRAVSQEMESEREDPLRQVVSVPLLQTQPFSSLKSNAMTNYPRMVDEWVDQFRQRQQRRNVDFFPNGTTHVRDGTRRRHRRPGSGSASRKTKEKSPERAKGKAKNRTTSATPREGKTASITRRDDLGDSGATVEPENAEKIEVSPIHTVQPVGGIASAELQSLMRILLRQFSSSAGSKLSDDMGLHIAPNYNVECCGDPIAAIQSKGLLQKEELTERRKK